MTNIIRCEQCRFVTSILYYTIIVIIDRTRAADRRTRGLYRGLGIRDGTVVSARRRNRTILLYYNSCGADETTGDSARRREVLGLFPLPFDGSAGTDRAHDCRLT